jgi:hypothetical protein
VACNLIVFSDSPIDNAAVVAIDEDYYNIGSYISLFPNPSNGRMELSFQGNANFRKAIVKVVGITGNVYDQFDWYGEKTSLDLTHLHKGVYFLKIHINDNIEVRKIVIQ